MSTVSKSGVRPKKKAEKLTFNMIRIPAGAPTRKPANLKKNRDLRAFLRFYSGTLWNALRRILVSELVSKVSKEIGYFLALIKLFNWSRTSVFLASDK